LFYRLLKLYLQEHKALIPDLSKFIFDPVGNDQDFFSVSDALRDRVQAEGILKLSSASQIPVVAIVGELHRNGVTKHVLETKKYKVTREGCASKLF